MTEHFYRFRSADALFGERAELESQEIYFASPAELNDPLEGFHDLFWQGDDIVWRNLLRNYVLCMMQSFAMVSIMGKDFEPNACAHFPQLTIDDLPDAPIRQVYSTICERFFAHPTVEELIDMLSQSSAVVRREELAFYLRALNPLALLTSRAVFDQFHGHSEAIEAKVLPADEAQITGPLENLSVLIKQRPLAPEVASVMFEASSHSCAQMDLIFRFNNPVEPIREGWLFLASDFSEFYVKSLEQLVFPKWYAACFVAEASDASMWGAYGDSHRGMCLKFQGSANEAGRLALSLYRAVGIGGRKGEEPVTHYDYAPLQFEAMQYAAGHPEIDFFRTLGTVAMGKLSSFWYAGPDGRRSTAAKSILDDQDAWRTKYWQDYQTSFALKTNDWAHERESRLVLTSGIEQSRKLRYRFEDLAGICFGINTPREDKLKAMAVIERKCLVEGRFDFEFSQARYSSRTKKIELMPLSLLKVTAGEPPSEQVA